MRRLFIDNSRRGLLFENPDRLFQAFYLCALLIDQALKRKYSPGEFLERSILISVAFLKRIQPHIFPFNDHLVNLRKMWTSATQHSVAIRASYCA